MKFSCETIYKNREEAYVYKVEGTGVEYINYECLQDNFVLCPKEVERLIELNKVSEWEKNRPTYQGNDRLKRVIGD